MKPEWMPPLPTAYEADYPDNYFTYFDDEQMHAYALAAVEAYKASLKPVAWRYVRSDGGRSLSLFPPNEVSGAAGLIGQPLYRLDGGDDG